MTFKVVDLFSGAGGFSRGFKEEGFKIIGAIENFKPIAETYKANFPEAKVLVEDIQEVHALDFLDYVGDTPDVIIGGPPCEPFTRANPRRQERPLDRLYKDPIGRLVLHFVRFVADLQPKVFVMENVPHIMEGELKYAILREFKRAGYETVYFNLLRAEHYGTPSRRLRVFISNIRIKPKRIRKIIRVIDAIGDLPEPDDIHDIPNHELVPLSPRKLRKIRRLRWGQSLVYYGGAEGRVYTNLTRIHPYKLAPTVMGSSRFIHPFRDRLLTVREHARLMGFPDDHIFLGGRNLQFNQVGEAVPVPLARAIAREIKKYLMEAE